jgi:hypothetical protein
MIQSSLIYTVYIVNYLLAAGAATGAAGAAAVVVSAALDSLAFDGLFS